MKPVAFGIATLMLAYTLTVCLIWSLTGNLDHDENQFMASAFMVMKNGLHPYQDFAHFHMPNLVYIYAPLFLTDNPIFYARVFTGLCAFGICFTIFWHGRYLLTNFHWFPRIVVPGITVILLVHSHIFKHSVSHAWNHASSVFLAVLAFVLLVRWRRNPGANWLIAVCGLTLGLAIGIRLTVVLLVIPFLFAILTHPDSSIVQRNRNVLVFAATGLAVNLPSLYFLLSSFNEFWYGNMKYPHLNTDYYRDIGFQRAMDFPGKLRYFFFHRKMSGISHQLIGYAGIASAALYAASFAVRRTIIRSDLLFLAFTIAFIMIGCLMATPSQKQYYFIVYPFFMIFILHMLQSVEGRILSALLVFSFAAILTISFISYSPYSFRDKLLPSLLHRESLTINKIKRESEQISQTLQPTPNGHAVLTLSPIFVINAKTQIYPEFSNGPFAFKYSYLMPPELVAEQKMIRQSDIEEFIQVRIPAAILTGHEKEDNEVLIVDAARKFNYSPISLPSGNTLWLPQK